MKFLQEKNGQSSSTRLIFFIGSIWVMLLTSYLALKGNSPGELIAIYSAIMGVLVGLKLGQKPMEVK
jgi:hypothetical protein